jgi:hypothetical protein
MRSVLPAPPRRETAPRGQVRYLVLPARPAGTEGWEEERLRTLVSRDSMIGVAVPRAPPPPPP